MAIVMVQAGAAAKLTVKSLPFVSGAETGVTPSAWKTPAVMLVGAVPHIPPAAGGARLGRMSVMVVCHAVLPPVFCTFRVKVPGARALMVAGPLFCMVKAGPTMVMAPLAPGAPLAWEPAE